MNNLPAFVTELFRFGLVGIMAASVHFSVVVFCVETLAMLPLIANIAAFIIAFQVSYWGHRLFTFKGTTIAHAEAFSKLLLVQLLNLAANETLFYILLSLKLSYPEALLITLTILPLFTYFSARLWVFR